MAGNTIVERARRVERLLEDGDVQAAFSSLRERYMDEWLNTEVTAKDVRDAIWHRVKVLDDVLAELGKWIDEGTVELHIEQSKERGFSLKW